MNCRERNVKEGSEAIQRAFQKAEKEWQDKHDEMWAKMPEEQRLAATDVIFRKLIEHAEEGGTYRKLIYDRLGFRVGGAYAVLYCAGGMTISNFFELPKKEISHE
jgi:hypothetical protein